MRRYARDARRSDAAQHDAAVSLMTPPPRADSMITLPLPYFIRAAMLPRRALLCRRRADTPELLLLADASAPPYFAIFRHAVLHFRRHSLLLILPAICAACRR